MTVNLSPEQREYLRCYAALSGGGEPKEIQRDFALVFDRILPEEVIVQERQGALAEIAALALKCPKCIPILQSEFSFVLQHYADQVPIYEEVLRAEPENLAYRNKFVSLKMITGLAVKSLMRIRFDDHAQNCTTGDVKDTSDDS